MSFHKRYISNEQVIRLFNDGGVDRIIQWYTQGADTIITESGIACEISDIVNDVEWLSFDQVSLKDNIIKLVHNELRIVELKK
jgi:hypothetical protein